MILDSINSSYITLTIGLDSAENEPDVIVSRYNLASLKATYMVKKNRVLWRSVVVGYRPPPEPPVFLGF